MRAFAIGINPPDKIGPELREGLGMPKWQPHVVLGSYDGDDALDAAWRHRDMLANSASVSRFYDGFLVAAEVTR